VPRVRHEDRRRNADRKLPVLLDLPGVRHDTSAPAGGLLRFLLVRGCTVPPGPGVVRGLLLNGIGPSGPASSRVYGATEQRNRPVRSSGEHPRSWSAKSVPARSGTSHIWSLCSTASWTFSSAWTSPGRGRRQTRTSFSDRSSRHCRGPARRCGGAGWMGWCRRKKRNRAWEKNVVDEGGTVAASRGPPVRRGRRSSRPTVRFATHSRWDSPCSRVRRRCRRCPRPAR